MEGSVPEHEQGAAASPEKLSLDHPVTGEPAPVTEEQLRSVTVGEVTPLTGPIEITDYDPEWPRIFAREAKAIRVALGARALDIHHVGSTSVTGLAAKPRIDIVLTVPDSADESAYVPALEDAGYVLRIREPDWYEHRVFKGPRSDLNLHVFSSGCAEIDRMLLFRDWLRGNETDRRLYERTKRTLATRTWTHTQDYANAKTGIVEEIIARASIASGPKANQDRST
ncbi:MAG: GrpB family protein [Chloroflexia bacterium]|nr:GrpB family protein [Chloroflexia bacterium]